MIIHQPGIVRKDDQVKLVSRVEFDTPSGSMPGEAYYAYPHDHEGQLSSTNEAFAAALLLVAMYFKEPLEIRGSVSSKFAYGLIEYGHIFRMWMPESFHEIEIKFEKVVAKNAAKAPSGVATAFSGGVDSHYSLLTNRAESQPLKDYQLTHGIYVHGLDINLDEIEAFQTSYQKYARVFKDFGLALIPVETNTREFSRYWLDWTIMSGGPLLGAGLGLEGLLSRYYIPSSFSYYNIVPNGSSPLTDHLLSTETLDIVHHAAHKRHYEKMEAISNWPVAHENLRVCIATPKPLDGYNCSRCNKCLANMVRFELFGVHEKFKTFRQPFSWKLFLHWWLIAQIGNQAIREVNVLAIKKGRWDIYIGMLGVKVGTFVNVKLRALIRFFFTDEQWYQFKRRFFGKAHKSKLSQFIIKYS
jgi:hypothetical protein